MSQVLFNKLIKNDPVNRPHMFRRVIGAALLASSLAFGVSSCKNADEYRPRASVVAEYALPGYSYADNKHLFYDAAASTMIPKEVKTHEIVTDLLKDGGALEYKSTAPILRSTWDNLISDMTGNGILVQLKDGSIVAQDPSQGNKVVSEEVYWLRISARMHYLGVSAKETQSFFDAFLKGVDTMTALAKADGGRGEFPAWVTKIVKGELVLNKDIDVNARNSASDADLDLIMSLLIAADNVAKGIWEDHGYTQRLLQLIGAVESSPNMFIKVGDTYVLGPSEDYLPTVEKKDWRLDYQSPETCFAVAQFLDKQSDPAMHAAAAKWRQFGDDAMKVYYATLAVKNMVPEKAWVSADAQGQLVITYNGVQTWDGIRGPLRMAQGLRYMMPNYEQHLLLQKYLERWGDKYTVSGLDEAAYLLLAVQMGIRDTAADLARRVVGEMRPTFIYNDASRYFQTSVIMMTLVETMFPYNSLQEQQITVSQADSRIGSDFKPVTLDQIINVDAADFYGRTPDGFGYVINNTPIKSLEELLRPGQFVVNSEGMVYGLIKAEAAGNEQRCMELVKTVYYLSQLNYYDTDRTLRSVPWAVIYDGKTFVIAEKPGIANFGNASATDSDMGLLYVLTKIAKRGWGGSELRNFIALQAREFIEQNTVSYRDTAGDWHFLMKSGGLTGGIVDVKNDRVLYQFHTSYPSYAEMAAIRDYFTADGWNNMTGSAYLYAAFTQVYLDTKALMGKITSAFPDPQNFPETLYIAIGNNGTISLVSNDKDYPVELSPEASFRLPIRLGQDPIQGVTAAEKVLSDYYAKAFADKYAKEVTPGYYMHYVNELSKIATTSSGERFSINDTILNNNAVGQFANMWLKHWALGAVSPFVDVRYDRIKQVADSSTYPSQLLALYQTRATDDFTLVQHIKFATELAKSRDTAPQALRVYEDTLMKYIAQKDLKSVLVGLTAVPVDKVFGSNPLVDKSQINLVGEYIEMLQSMFGYNDAQVLNKIDALLVLASKTGAVIDHPVVKALYFEKLLRWGNLSPLARNQIRETLVQQGYAELIAYLEMPPFRQDDLRPITITLEGQTYSTDMLSAQELSRNTVIPQKLKEMLIGEIVKREVKEIYSKYVVTETVDQAIRALQVKEQQQALQNYIAQLPSVFSVRGLIPIIYADGLLDPSTNLRTADPIAYEVKAALIVDTLSALTVDPENADSVAKYMSIYPTLWSAYKLMIYKDISTSLQHFKLGHYNKDVKKAQQEMSSLAHNLRALLVMTDMVQSTGIAYQAEDITDPVIKQFKDKFSALIYADIRGGYGYGDTLADVMNNLYWLGYDLDRLVTANPELTKDYAALFAQLKPAVYGKAAGKMGMIEIYTTQHPRAATAETRYSDNDQLNGAIERILLQEESNQAKVVETIALLHKAQAQAKLYGHTQEYAYYLVAEAYIYSKVPYHDDKNGKTGYTYYQEIQKDERKALVNFDFLKRIVDEMDIFVKANYGSTGAGSAWDIYSRNTKGR